jgi:hypothetical protein
MAGSSTPIWIFTGRDAAEGVPKFRPQSVSSLRNGVD